MPWYGRFAPTLHRAFHSPRLVGGGALVVLLLALPIAARAAPSQWVVNSTADTAGSCTVTSCTLRAAIDAANSSVGPDVISFNIQPSGPKTIAVGSSRASGLPVITGSDVTIDGTTQPGGGAYGVRLDDPDASGAESGLVIEGSRTTIRGLSITRFDSYGILIRSGSRDNIIVGNVIGSRDGTTDDGTGNDGIHILGGGGNRIGGSASAERNIVSGGRNDGIEIEDSSDNVVIGNFVGLTGDGLARLPNADSGVEINGLSLRNRVGGAAAGERNYVSGNDGIGVQILGSMRGDGTCETPQDNVVVGNYLGLNVNGVKPGNYGNLGEGAQVSTCARFNRIGGAAVGERNVISGNRADGVELDSSGGPGGTVAVCDNIVQGNYIGSDPSGMVAVPNVDDGIGIDNGACNNLIGGATAGAGNLISGNYNDGIDISRAGSNGNRVEGNVIGLSADGSTVLRNTKNGIYIRSRAQGNQIVGNVISANVENGIALLGFQTYYNVISGNKIGSNVAGTVSRGNKKYGVLMTDGPQSNRVENNLIRGNELDGIALEKVSGSSYATRKNRITRNQLGFDFGLGIDLLPADGVNPNNGNNAEAGVANQGMDYPVITAATSTSVAGTAPAGSIVELFGALAGTGEANGEGWTYLGTATAAANGSWCIGGISASGLVTATATNSTDDTSEFAANVAVSGSAALCGGPTPSPTPVPTPSPTPVPTPSPTPVPTPSPTPVPDPTTVALIPVADANVREDQPTVNFGSDQSLVVRYRTSAWSYLRFDTSSLAGKSVLGAKLRLTVGSGTDPGSVASGGVVARVTDTAWNEATINWSNKPPIDRPDVDVLGGVAGTGEVEFDVTSAFDDGTGAVIDSGLVTLAVRSGASDDVIYRSREALTGTPQLILTVTGAAPIPAPVRVIRGPYVQDVTGTGATIIWRTPLPGPSVIRYGTTAGLELSASGPSGVEHVVTLTGLSPGIRYQYAVEASGGLITPVATFLAAPTPGTAFSFAAWGDSGIGTAPQMAIANRIDVADPDLTIHTGDVVYPDSDRISWDPYFFLPYEATLADAPFFGSHGNHEMNGDPTEPYLDYLQLPTSPSGGEKYYSFDYGDVHFVSLDSEQSLLEGSAQYQWLESDLAGTTRRFTVVFMHRPVYGNSTLHPGDPSLQAALGPLFARNSVELVLSGHAHNYERSVPIDGVTYVVTGGGGAALYDVSPGSTTASAGKVHHFVRATVGPSLLTLQAVLSDGTVYDTWSTAPRGDITPPSTVTVQPADQVTSAAFRVQWSAATDDIAVAGYRLDVATDAGFTSFAPGYQDRDVGNVLATTVSGLAPETSYWVRVRARDTSGNTSADSNVVTVTTSAPSGDTTRPTIGTLSAPTAITRTSVSLAWTAASDDTGVTGYRLDVARDAGFTDLVTGYSDRDVGATLDATVSGLAAGTSYWARIRAVDAAGNTSTDSNAVGAVTALLADAFDRLVTGGWGASEGLAWSGTGTAADYSVDGTVGSIVQSATGSRHATIGVGARDITQLVRFRLTRLPTASWNGIYVLARTAGSSNWYGVRLRSVAGGSDDMEFNRSTSAGIAKVGTTAIIPELALEGWYWVRLEAYGDGTTTTLNARLWADGQPEPATWTITASDTTAALQSAGGIGIRLTSSSTSQPAALEVDSLTARRR